MNFIKPFFAILFIILQFNACQNASQASRQHVTETNQMNSINQDLIAEITLEYYGGMQAHKEILHITSSQTNYQFQNLQHPKPIIKTEKTSPELWAKLNATFDEQSFSEIQNGDSQVLFDGLDYVFRINGNFDEIVLTNPLATAEQETFFEEIKNLQRKFFAEVQKD